MRVHFGHEGRAVRRQRRVPQPHPEDRVRLQLVPGQGQVREQAVPEEGLPAHGGMTVLIRGAMITAPNPDPLMDFHLFRYRFYPWNWAPNGNIFPKVMEFRQNSKNSGPNIAIWRRYQG